MIIKKSGGEIDKSQHLRLFWSRAVYRNGSLLLNL